MEDWGLRREKKDAGRGNRSSPRACSVGRCRGPSRRLEWRRRGPTLTNRLQKETFGQFLRYPTERLLADCGVAQSQGNHISLYAERGIPGRFSQTPVVYGESDVVLATGVRELDPGIEKTMQEMMREADRTEPVEETPDVGYDAIDCPDGQVANVDDGPPFEGS